MKVLNLIQPTLKRITRETEESSQQTQIFTANTSINFEID
jgi:hypothetical protein